MSGSAEDGGTRTPVPSKDVALVIRSKNTGPFEKLPLRVRDKQMLVEVANQLGAVERTGELSVAVQRAARCSRGEVGGEVTV